MPRKARIDAPGGLHHIICRGIERRKIFDDNADRENFYDIDRVVEKVAEIFDMAPVEVWKPGNQPQRVKARSLVCYWAVRELGMSGTNVSKLLGIGQPAVSRSVVRGEKLAQDMNLGLIG